MFIEWKPNEIMQCYARIHTNMGHDLFLVKARGGASPISWIANIEQVRYMHPNITYDMSLAANYYWVGESTIVRVIPPEEVKNNQALSYLHHEEL